MTKSAKRRVAVIGTGHRGAGTWGKELLATCGDWVELVALCDSNKLRLSRARDAIGAQSATFTDLDVLLREARPETLIVCTRDHLHDEHIVKALEAGVDVITEKPMATTAAKVRRILDAERRTGRRLDVAFNYRCAPTAQRIKELLLSGAIGEIVSVDFHWYLDVEHGADYFRRWHAFVEQAGSLFVHKATHHFDLLSWYLGAEAQRVFAQGALRHYGRNGLFRGQRCKGCVHTARCRFHFDISADPWLEMLYEEPSREDGYFRDACVFREDIDIFDTMTAAIAFENGVQVSYSLNAAMPIEGYHLAFNGREGRIEIRQYERQAWETPEEDEIALMRNFGGVERLMVKHGTGGHFGGDPVLQRLLFEPGAKDPLGQRATSRAGAISVVTGVAALESARTGKPVEVRALLEP
jgi:predicted dehydrogenase